MKQVKDYTIICGESAAELSYKVAELLDKGLQPYGSPYATGYRDRDGSYVFMHYQAMVEYAPDGAVWIGK